MALRRPVPSAAPGSSGGGATSPEEKRRRPPRRPTTPSCSTCARELDEAIRVSLEREPSVALAAAVEGERHAT